MTKGITDALKDAGFEHARNFEDIKERFIEIARLIMFSHELVSKAANWRITALELYVKTASDVWRDPYTHGHEEQLNAGTWYVHDDGKRAPTYSGIDITCGSRDAGLYGGLLIRELDREKRWSFQRIVRGNQSTFPRVGNVWSADEGAAISQIHRTPVESGTTVLRSIKAAEHNAALYIGPRLGLSNTHANANARSPDGVEFRTAPLRIATWPTAHLKTFMKPV